MILRKLDKEEHQKTRALWEEIFQEDTEEFLNYYYYIKTRENDIYVVEEDGGICSMLHLNPYRVMIEGEEAPSAYIIAVSTRKPYRSRGYMGVLLSTSLNDMYGQKVPFTFLMPAAEAIYTPYDFRFIYDQDIGVTGRPEAAEGKCVCADASLWQAGEIADFFNEHYGRAWQIRTVRDHEYYQTMIMEQQSERGGVRLMKEDGRLCGVYAYAAEGTLEIREPLFLPGYEEEFLRSVGELAASVRTNGRRPGEQRERGSAEEIKIYACPDVIPCISREKKPLIMARIVCLPELLKMMTVSEEEEVDCSFAVIDPLIRQNSRVWRITSRKGETRLHVQETEDSEGVLPVAELTEILFGRLTPRDIKDRENVMMTERLEEELAKITKLTRVFLNEIV